MDRFSESALLNGLSARINTVFSVPSDFKAGGLRFDHTHDVDTSQLVSGGNGDGIFKASDKSFGPVIDKCRFDQEGGATIDIIRSP